MRIARMTVPACVLVLALTGCSSVEIAPEPVIPKPLVAQMPVRAAVVLSKEQKDFKHNEKRGSVDWQVKLGIGHGHLAQQVFGALFYNPLFLEDLEEARHVAGLGVIFEPKMEQYSFATATETGGDYFAVTLRYRINVFSPDLQLVDSYTLTGYGNSRDGQLSSSKPMEDATRAAMRDAAAKFLVQFPEQAVGQRLARGEALAAPSQAAVAGPAPVRIEAVPVLPSAPAAAPTSAPVPPPALPAPGTPSPESPAAEAPKLRAGG